VQALIGWCPVMPKWTCSKNSEICTGTLQ